jgi:hypothetical protein
MIIKVDARVQKAPEMQEVITKYGCSIKVRLGLHEAGDVCSNQGLIIMQLAGKDEENNEFAKELNAIEGIKAKLVEI